jgi:hypothetical protein
MQKNPYEWLLHNYLFSSHPLIRAAAVAGRADALRALNHPHHGCGGGFLT